MQHTKLFRLTAVILALLCIAPLALAQPAGPLVTAIPPELPAAPPPPADQGSFFATAQAYFTSFNTNLSWAQRGDFAAGIVSMSSGPVPLANDLRLSYDTWKALSLESVTRNSGIAGTFVSEQLGIGLNFKVYDAKLTLYGDAGYSAAEPAHRYYGEFGARVAKKMTKYTFAGVGIGTQVPTGRQVFTAFAGFNF